MTTTKHPVASLEITTDPSRFDLDVIHGYLTRSYWSPGIPREIVERAIAGSLGFAAFEHGRQIGFARVITDRATFAYLADVFVLEEFRRRGVASKIMEAIVAHPDLQNLRRWLLVTRDAHPLYEKFGFRPLAIPERHMERVAGSGSGAGNARCHESLLSLGSDMTTATDRRIAEPVPGRFSAW